MADEIVTGSSGASLTFPIRAGEVKKGTHVMLKNHPCKVVDVSTSKTGKHGHAKANITGLDIFTNKKYEEICPTSHNMVAPVVTRSEWILTDIGEEMGFAALMDESGEMREDLRVPDDEEYAQLRTSWNEAMDAGKDFYVTVVGAPVINGGKEEPMERIMPNGFQAKQA